MDGQPRIGASREEVAGFCRRHNIARFSLFGSVLSDRFGRDSDVDVLVEFEPGNTPGLLSLASIERELSEIFGGRKVDLQTPSMLSRYFRDEVLQKARLEYAD